MKQLTFKTLLFITFIFVVFGCKEKKEREYDKNGVLIKRSYYKNGNIEQEGSYLNDSIRHGWRKGYYEDGKLQYTSEYKNGVPDGWTIHYYENGNIENKIHYKDSLAEGKAYWYYLNGSIKSEGYYLRDIEVGNLKLFYPNGKFKAYYSSDLDGNTRYIRKYDSTGNVTEDKGRILVQFLIEGDSDSVKVGKKIKAGVLIAEPPNTKTSVLMGEINNKGEITDLKEYTKIIKESIVPYQEKIYTELGKYKIIAVGKMLDLKTGSMKSDTIISDITVVK